MIGFWKNSLNSTLSPFRLVKDLTYAPVNKNSCIKTIGAFNLIYSKEPLSSVFKNFWIFLNFACLFPRTPTEQDLRLLYHRKKGERNKGKMINLLIFKLFLMYFVSDSTKEALSVLQSFCPTWKICKFLWIS